MRTVTRRELSHDSARILDEVLATGEPVEVTTKGRPSLLIYPKPASLYEQWESQGLIKRGEGRLAGLPRASSPDSVQTILDDVRGDH